MRNLAPPVLVLLLLAPVFGDATTDIMVILNRDSNTPYYSTWDGSSWSGDSPMSSVGSSPRYIVARNCPTRDEIICVTQDDDEDLNVQFWDGSSWGSATQLCSNTDETEERPFDAAYEQSSGDCLIIYADDDENNWGYYTWDGSTLSGETDLSLPTGSDSDWIILESKPGSDEIMGIFHIYEFGLYASVWNGSSWGSFQLLENDLYNDDEWCFDFAYEQTSGDGVVVWTDYGDNSPRYRTWNGSSWSSESALPSIGGEGVWIRLASDPASDEIIFVAIDDNSDINAVVWDGSSWGAAQEFENDVEDMNRPGLDVCYESGGGEALCVYFESSEDRLQYRTWDGSSWSSEQNGTNMGAATRVILMDEGSSTGEIHIAVADDDSELEMVRWDGSSMSGKTTIDNDLQGSVHVENFAIVGASNATLEAAKVVVTDAGDDFIIGASTTLTVQIQTSDDVLVTSDSSTQVTINPSSQGTVSSVTTGTGDGSYGAIGGAETITVSGGVATIVLTNATAETFSVAITNGSTLSNPADDSIEVFGATQVAITSAGSDFTAGGTTTLTVQIQTAASQLVASDSSTVVTLAPSGSGAVSGVTAGTGDGTYGLPGVAEAVTVSSGVATIELTDAVVETFTVVVTNNAGLSNPAPDSITVLDAPSGLDPLLVWAQSSTSTPKYSVWDGSSWSAEAAATSVGGNPYWVVARAAPNRTEYALGTQDSHGDVNLQFYDGSSWGSVTELSSNAGTGSDERAFDMVYEQSSGTLMVVYSDNNESNLGYRTFDGSTLSAEADLSLPGGGDSTWITLAANPGSDEVVLVHLGDDHDIDANVWDGSNFSGWTQMTSDCNSDSTERYGVAFETNSGHGLLCYRGGGDYARYRTWDGSAWSSESSMPSMDNLRFLKLSADPDISSDVVLFACTRYYDEIMWCVWDGSSWSTATEIESDSANDDQRCFDISWESSGSSAVLCYMEDGYTTVRYRVWDGSSLGAEMTGPEINEDDAWVQLVQTLTVDEILVVTNDEDYDLNATFWDGSSFGSATELESSLHNDRDPSRAMVAVRVGSTTNSVTVTNWTEVRR